MASIKELGQCLGTKGSGRLVVALLWANAAWAAPTASWMPSSFAAQFTQIYTSAVSGKEQRGQGSLDYAYPGQIRFQANIWAPAQAWGHGLRLDLGLNDVCGHCWRLWLGQIDTGSLTFPRTVESLSSALFQNPSQAGAL